jgi:hypothetical protein
MNLLISCCGLNCEACEARIAHVTNDDKLRAETAEKWRVQYHAEGITPEMINCSGCRAEGAKIGHWGECKIRLCAADKGYQTCGECAELNSCELVGHVLKFSPEAAENLKNLQ